MAPDMDVFTMEEIDMIFQEVRIRMQIAIEPSSSEIEQVICYENLLVGTYRNRQSTWNLLAC